MGYTYRSRRFYRPNRRSPLFLDPRYVRLSTLAHFSALDVRIPAGFHHRMVSFQSAICVYESCPFISLPSLPSFQSTGFYGGEAHSGEVAGLG